MEGCMMQSQSDINYINRSYYIAQRFRLNATSFKVRMLGRKLEHLCNKILKRAMYGRYAGECNSKATSLAEAIFYADKSLHQQYQVVVHEMRLLQSINGFTHKEVIPDDQLLPE